MKTSKGFTIVELIIVMAIFLFIIGAAISIFVSIVINQKKILAEQQFLNQVSYTEEYMSKALRMASVENDENCLIDGAGTDHPGFIYLLTRYDNNLQLYRGIKFINQTGDVSGTPICQEFFVDNVDSAGSNNLDVSKPLVIKEKKGDADPIEITSSGLAGVQINSVRFSVNGMDGSALSNICTGDINACGASANDENHQQPRITIIMNVKVPNDEQEPVRTIQTTVSQRNLNVQ